MLNEVALARKKSICIRLLCVSVYFKETQGEAMEVIMVQNGKAMVINVSPKFAFAFGKHEGA